VHNVLTATRRAALQPQRALRRAVLRIAADNNAARAHPVVCVREQVLLQDLLVGEAHDDHEEAAVLKREEARPQQHDVSPAEARLGQLRNEPRHRHGRPVQAASRAGGSLLSAGGERSTARVCVSDGALLRDLRT
jgi:hypothetical protein